LAGWEGKEGGRRKKGDREGIEERGEIETSELEEEEIK
jgi:hypothetical protein